MKAPEWLCSVICAGLDVDEILDDARPKAKPKNPNSLVSKFDTVLSQNQEEQNVLNVNQNTTNAVAYTENM